MSPQPSRILYLCGGRSFTSAAPPRKIQEVVNCWRRAGHDVRHVCGGDVPPRPPTESPAVYGAQATHTRWFRKIPMSAPLITSLSERRDIQHDAQMLNFLRNGLEDWRPDLVWERSCRLHAAGLDFAREIGVPYVLEWKDHLVDYRHSLFRGRALKLEMKKNHSADHVVVESGVLRNALAAEGIDARKIIVAHNAVDASQFKRSPDKRSAVRAELGIADDDILVGYLGSYAFYHDTIRLVLAANILRKGSQARSIRFLMVGAGLEYTETRERAQALGLLDDMITMRPGVPKEDVPGILAALDLAVLPGSTDIICPIKVQEYMASALPAVVPDHACNREVIEDGRTGALFEPHNAGALADQIMRLAEDESLRIAMGKAARAEIEQRFLWEQTWGAALETTLSATLSTSVSA